MEFWEGMCLFFLPLTLYPIICLCLRGVAAFIIFLIPNPMCLSAVSVAPVVQPQQLFLADCRVPALFSEHIGTFCVLADVPGSSCVSPAPALDSAVSPEGSFFLSWEDGVRNQDPAPGCAHCCRAPIAYLTQLTEMGSPGVCTQHRTLLC